MASTTIGRVTLGIVKWLLIVLVVLTIIVAIGGYFAVRAIVYPDADAFGTVEDEAKVAGLDKVHFTASAAPHFVEMDKGLLTEPPLSENGEPQWPPEILEVSQLLDLPPQEVREAAIRGQNTWIVWTGGNDRFWDYAANNPLAGGAFDLLKVISSHTSQAYGRRNRWHYLGLVNRPCYRAASEGDPAHFGLWIDQPTDAADCEDDPFADATEHPGVEIGARGEAIVGDGTCEEGPSPTGSEEPDRSAWPEVLPVGSYYGEPTGIVGLRLFPNPDFDAEARDCWDPVRFYNDPEYYNDRDLVRPYRVGMSCAFCHVGPNPVNPPDDPENPRWDELTSNPGAQYYWVNRIFFWDTAPRSEPTAPSANEGSLLYQLFHTNPPGALDTSLVSTDYMNNPRTMNAVYNVIARQLIAADRGIEELVGEERNNKQLQDYPQTAALAPFYDTDSGKVGTMRVLKDGADSVGTLGALNRVYINIGLFSEEWLLHFRPFLGGRKISPIKISDAQENSVYWQATEEQTADMAIFFLVTARPDKLEEAVATLPEPGDHLEPFDSPVVTRGKRVFGANCAACHSSKQPEPPAELSEGVCEGGGHGANYRQCWERYFAWTQTDEYKAQMVDLVLDEAGADEPFLTNNYLSIDQRVPLDVMGTNACTAIATNGLEGDIWDNFTSSSYKSLPAVGEVTVHHPVSGGAMPFQPLGNGRGYLRPPSLVSVWSTAPYLSNNSLGHEELYYSADGYYRAPADEYDGVASPTGPVAEQAPRETADTDADQPREAADAAEPQDIAYAGPTPDPVAYPKGEDYGAACPSANPDDPYLPCVENRLRVFDQSIRKLLWPELRRTDDLTDNPVPGYIYRFSAPACYVLPPTYLTDTQRTITGLLSNVAPWAFTDEGGIALGPLPAGFPSNALFNTQILPDNDEGDMWGHIWNLAKAAPTLMGAFKELGGQCSAEALADPATQRHAEEVVRESELVDTLVGLSKCPDYVVNKGHTFGSDLSDQDKNALIEYLKHM